MNCLYIRGQYIHGSCKSWILDDLYGLSGLFESTQSTVARQALAWGKKSPSTLRLIGIIRLLNTSLDPYGSCRSTTQFYDSLPAVVLDNHSLNVLFSSLSIILNFKSGKITAKMFTINIKRATLIGLSWHDPQWHVFKTETIVLSFENLCQMYSFPFPLYKDIFNSHRCALFYLNTFTGFAFKHST